jgi:hypothetical protein
MDLPNRTLVLRIANKISDAAARDLPWSALEAWYGAKEAGEETTSLVWSCLTTPTRDYLRQTQNTHGASNERTTVDDT